MANEAPGNSLLLNMFMMYSSPSEEDRKHATPLIFFKRVDYDGRKKGNLMFQGYGIIEGIELVTQFDPKLSIPYFSFNNFNTFFLTDSLSSPSSGM